MQKSLFIILLLMLAGLDHTMAQLAQFSFGGPSTVSGWTNLPGDPYTGVRTATANGITISSISTSNWAPNSVPSAEYNFGGTSPGVYFPDAVMQNSWLQYNGSSYNLALYNAAVPQLKLSGLNKDSTYILRMTGSDKYYMGNTQYTVAGVSLAGSQLLNAYNNTTQGITFTGVQPDSNGTIRIYVSATSGALFAFISGVQVFSGSANVGVPVVALTAPANGTNQSEGGNLVISATASESGGSIAKVEFYADTTKIGEDDTSPYSMTWVDPDPAVYQITVKATDAIGTIATASVNVKIQSLNYFWSTTGNIATNGDSNFIGTVDTNRLSFRTNNDEHMSISPTGTVMVGTDKEEDSLQLQGTMYISDTSADAPLTIDAESNFSPWVDLTNTNSSVGASIGMRYYNDSGLVAQFFSGSHNDHYMPNGFGFHDVSGGGFDFVSYLPSSFVSWGNNFKALGGSKMIFYPGTGHLIIGSTRDTGSYLLQVNGSAVFTKVKIKPFGNWPDYVFKSGYVLPDLAEVERYIHSNHHLPGIASAQDVQLDGIDVSEQQAAMLKKIEELTLYVIRENKTLAEQDKQITGQSNRIADQNRQLAEQNARLDAQQKEIDELKAMIQAKK